MDKLDELILRNALASLDKAQEQLKAGGPVGEVMAALLIGWAATDIKIVLATQPVEA